MGSVEQGARQAVEKCVKVKKGEMVVIITDKETMEIGKAIKQAAESITSNIHFFVMEDFGKRPFDFPEKIGKILAEADASFYVAQDAKNEGRIFDNPMLKVVSANKKSRRARMPRAAVEVIKKREVLVYLRDVQRVDFLSQPFLFQTMIFR